MKLSINFAVIWLATIFIAGTNHALPAPKTSLERLGKEHYIHPLVKAPLDQEYCDLLAAQYIPKAQPCLFSVANERTTACLHRRLTDNEYVEFETLFKLGCIVPFIPGSNAPQHERRKVKPCYYISGQPPRLEGLWPEWEAFENKLKDLLLHHMANIAPKVPDSWLKHYPFSGGKGRIGKWTDEHPDVEVENPMNACADHPIHTDHPKRSQPQIYHENLAAAEKYNTILARLRSKAIMLKEQQRKVDKKSLQKRRNSYTLEGVEPVNTTQAPKTSEHIEAQEPPHLPGKICAFINDNEEQVSYEEATKNDNGLALVKCVSIDPGSTPPNTVINKTVENTEHEQIKPPTIPGKVCAFMNDNSEEVTYEEAKKNDKGQPLAVCIPRTSTYKEIKQPRSLPPKACAFTNNKNEEVSYEEATQNKHGHFHVKCITISKRDPPVEFGPGPLAQSWWSWLKEYWGSREGMPKVDKDWRRYKDPNAPKNPTVRYGHDQYMYKYDYPDWKKLHRVEGDCLKAAKQKHPYACWYDYKYNPEYPDFPKPPK